MKFHPRNCINLVNGLTEFIHVLIFFCKNCQDAAECAPVVICTKKVRVIVE